MRKAHIILRNMRLGTTVFTDQVAKTFQLQTLHIGEILRTAYQEDSQLSLRLKRSLESGELVPDDLITELIERETASFPGDFLLIDYPRTVNQFHELHNLFRKTGIILEKLWILELTDIEPLIASQTKTKLAEKMDFHQKFAPEAEEILRVRFQHANESIRPIKQALKEEGYLEIIRYNHPLEDQMDEICARL
jgi:adenylate kinase